MMADYIPREAAVKIAERYGLTHGSVLGRHSGIADCITSEIESIPAADVVEVVHGRWQRIGIFKKDGPIYPCCSVCGIVSAAYKSQWEGLQGPWKYCPECGAKMDGKEE